jgi:hypothetical protein
MSKVVQVKYSPVAAVHALPSAGGGESHRSGWLFTS